MADIKRRAKPTRNETYIGYGLLLVLILVAIGVFLTQFRYSPAVLVGSSSTGDRIGGPSVDLREMSLTDLAEGMVSLSPPEVFGPENLSDKIDGKAELYLSAGFLKLLCQRLADTSGPNSWMEVFVYDMGTLRKAFAVYSVQRRPDPEKVDVTDFAYKTENALFFAHGRYYVELIAAAVTEMMAERIRSFAKNFVRDIEVRGGGIDELALFPREGLDEDGITLLISDAFGFDRFDNVFMARYTLENAALTAFLSVRLDRAEASELAEAYHAFLIANGGTDVKMDTRIPGARLVRILDTFELMFNYENTLAGVHAAEDRGEAERLAVAVMRKLSGVNP